MTTVDQPGRFTTLPTRRRSPQPSSRSKSTDSAWRWSTTSTPPASRPRPHPRRLVGDDQHVGHARRRPASRQAVNDGGPYESARNKMMALDFATQLQEMKAIAGQPDFALGSVHAITRDGTLVIASASGSQLASYAWGAANVIFVVGAQKLVSSARGRRERITSTASRSRTPARTPPTGRTARSARSSRSTRRIPGASTSFSSDSPSASEGCNVR